jgi:hypothetical protein
MKKIFLFLVVFTILFSFSACEKDDSLDPRPVIVAGQYVRLDITSKVLKSIRTNSPNPQFTSDEVAQSSFGGLLTDPSGTVVKYNLYVKKRDINGVASEFKLLKVITSFPTNLEISSADIATALGIPTSEIVWAEEYFFYGESFNAAGKRADFYSLSATVQGAPGMKQAYRFKTSTQERSFFLSQANLDQYDNYANP